jgi:hypothetical protein
MEKEEDKKNGKKMGKKTKKKGEDCSAFHCGLAQ